MYMTTRKLTFPFVLFLFVLFAAARGDAHQEAGALAAEAKVVKPSALPIVPSVRRIVTRAQLDKLYALRRPTPGRPGGSRGR